MGRETIVAQLLAGYLVAIKASPPKTENQLYRCKPHCDSKQYSCGAAGRS